LSADAGRPVNASRRRLVRPVKVLIFALVVMPWPRIVAAQMWPRVLPMPAPAPISRWHSDSSARTGVPALVGQAAFLLDDATGRTLYAYHADALRYPASTVKMLTAIVVARRLNPARVVTVPAEAIVDPSIFTSARLSAGERMTVRNLLYGLLVPSGNDAATTLAEAGAGTNRAFATLMNAEARRLHLWHSHFLGAAGLDTLGQYTTARDLGWLAHALLRNLLLARIVHTRTYRTSSVDGRYRHTWTSLNRLLWSYPGAIGVKTGTTPLAGANLVAAASRKSHRIIAVVLGSSVASRFSDGAKLLDYGWQLLDRTRVSERSSNVSVLPVHRVMPTTDTKHPPLRWSPIVGKGSSS
jgi:D-alanyl-D-alanine carboxypeptidase (penicillin-binding protein 5/6)